MKQQNQPPAPQNPLSRTFLGVATGLLASLHGRDSSQLRAPPRGDASDQAETTNRSIRSLAPLGGFPANALQRPEEHSLLAVLVGALEWSPLRLSGCVCVGSERGESSCAAQGSV